MVLEAIEFSQWALQSTKEDHGNGVDTIVILNSLEFASGMTRCKSRHSIEAHRVKIIHLILSSSQQFRVPKTRRRHDPTHLLIVLGSGGHTAEMLSMLRRLPLDPTVYTHRTYLITTGDSFSATKAAAFEKSLQERYRDSGSYSIITVPRARRVHQSFLTAPLSTLQCFWVCLCVLRGTHPQRPPQGVPRYPDLILTNGPATAVCVVLAAKLIRFIHAVTGIGMREPSIFPLRTIFIESWARVTTLSLSGRILLPFVDRFLVQWPSLAGKRAWRGMRETEYAGTLVE